MRGNFIATEEEDVRIKLADRLHHMRALGFVKPEKQKPIAAAAQMMGGPTCTTGQKKESSRAQRAMP